MPKRTRAARAVFRTPLGELEHLCTNTASNLQEHQTLPPSGSANKPFGGRNVCDSKSFDVFFVTSPGKRSAKDLQCTIEDLDEADTLTEVKT